ncbi:MAG: HAD-IA family hydrolase [Porticoccaceae bacterium]
MSRRPELLVFDWDGTLSDSLARIVECLQLSACEQGLPPPTGEQGREVIGLGLGEALHSLFPELDDARLAALRASYSRNYAFLDREPAPFYPGVLETLDTLRDAGFALVVATGKSRRGYDRVVAGHGLEGFFRASRCADETASKPDPRMLNELLAECGCPPGRALMVGDTEFDMAMAARAGVPRLGVSYGAHHPDRLQPYGLLACVDRFADILSCLE